MPESNMPHPEEDRIRFTSDCDILEIREEDTTPGMPEQDYRAYRRWLEEKYGRRSAPPNEPPKQAE